MRNGRRLSVDAFIGLQINAGFDSVQTCLAIVTLSTSARPRGFRTAEDHPRRPTRYLPAVSYTHLTLPTIYSV